jgi:hypothetical protein
LIYDIIRRQHEDVTERTLTKVSVGKLRQENIRGRETALELMRTGTPASAELFWRKHLENMRDLVLAAYPAPMTIDVLNEPNQPVGKLRAVGKVKRKTNLAKPAARLAA